MTRQVEKIIDAAHDIALDRPTIHDTAWLARQLVQATLPHSDPGDVPAWGRRNGDLSLTISPSWEIDKITGKPVSSGIPYGTIPRLLLFWITTEAVKRQSRKIELGNSLSDFMRELDIVPTGGRWGSITRLRIQMNRLFKARISFDQTQNNNNSWLSMEIAPKGQLWWDYKTPEKGSLFNSWIELGESFYTAITAAPVPLDMRALKALRKSPLALDLYAWATYTTYSASKNNKPRSVAWDLLHQQFGGAYGETKEFARNAKKAFVKIQTVYPDLAISFPKGGVCIEPSNTAVLQTPPSPKKSLTK